MNKTNDGITIPDWKQSILQRLENNSLPLDECAHEIQHHGPKFLYRYRKAANHDHLDSLKKNLEWMSPPTSFNDPYDSAFCVNWNHIEQEAISPEKIIEMWTALRLDENLEPHEKDLILKGEKPLDLLIEKLTEKSQLPETSIKLIRQTMAELSSLNRIDCIKKFREIFRVCCLSETPSSIQMWAHYAGMHTGFAIEYETAALLKMKNLRVLPVVYQSELPERTECFQETANGKFGKFVSACCTKQADWAYEQEWRLITLKEALWRRPQCSSSPINMPKPTRVLLGVGIKPGDREHIQHLCQNLGIGCVAMMLNPTSFKIEEKPAI